VQEAEPVTSSVVFGSYGDDPRPPEAEIAEAAHALGFELQADAATPLGLRGLLEIWREVAVNGGAFSASFALTAVMPAAEWCLRNARLEHLDYTRRFLTSPAVTEVLPDHQTDDVMMRQAQFTDLHPLQLEGDLALRLALSGAHRTFPGTTDQAKTIAAEAAADLIGNRYDDFVITSSHDGWAPWFGWAAWDRTWIITDTRQRTVSLLALTDTD